jgi:hypothetical protein
MKKTVLALLAAATLHGCASLPQQPANTDAQFLHTYLSQKKGENEKTEVGTFKDEKGISLIIATQDSNQLSLKFIPNVSTPKENASTVQDSWSGVLGAFDYGDSVIINGREIPFYAMSEKSQQTTDMLMKTLYQKMRAYIVADKN